MSQDEKKTNKKKLLLSVVMLSISILITTTSIFGWFISLRDSDVQAFNLSVTSQLVEGATINSYAISAIERGETQSTFQLATQEGQLVPLYNMPSFDEHGIVLNDYHPALAIKITFTASENIVPVVRAQAKQGLVTVGVNNWMSNCVQFDFAAYDEENLILTTDNMPTAFVGIEEDELDKTSEIEIHRGSQGDGTITIWFIIEYNKDVLLKLQKLNEELEAEIVTYHNDITFIVDAV